MAVKKGKTNPSPVAANVAIAKHLIARLEAAHRAGTLEPVIPDAKSVTMEIRVKGNR